MRCAITIIYNGIHHLKHGNFVPFMLENFDRWIVVEGHARPGGTTSWCNHLKYQSAESTDGTREFLRELPIDYIEGNGFWESKDAQFQAGVERLKEPCMLWQVDADEWWRRDQLEKNERVLNNSPYNVGQVGFNHVVGSCEGQLLIARGKWGSGLVNRVWKWNGERFLTHEPPTMEGQTQAITLPERFMHFSYYFEKDVEFKAKYYKGHENIYKGWKELQKFKASQFPCHIYRAFGRKTAIGRTATKIHREMWREEKGMLL